MKRTRSAAVTGLLGCLLAALLLCPARARAREKPEPPRILYVNNLRGSDKFNGLAPEPQGDGTSGPFASIRQAFDSVRTSDRIEIANTGKPYRGNNYLRRAGGTAERPLVINGNGATISGLDQVPKEKWKRVRDNIVATPFWPMSNYLKGYSPIQHWIGTPQIWWLDGRPAPNCTSEAELNQTPGGFYWNKPKRELWVHLPAGRTLDQVKIEIPVHGTCICVNTDFVTVKNLRGMLSWNDGFDAHGQGKNIVYQNCIATDNCGQGFSVHDTNVVLYEDCLAERNASSGSCDVNDSQSTYRRCVFVNNSFEAGVYATEQSTHTYQDCLIFGNAPFEQIWQRGRSTMNFINCVIIGRKGSDRGILSMQNGSVYFRQCTISDAAFLGRLDVKRSGRLTVFNCILTRFTKPFLSIPSPAPNRVVFAYNVFFDSPGIAFGGQTFGRENWREFPKAGKLGKNSVWLDPGLTGPLGVDIPKGSPLLKRGRRHGRPTRAGALLPASVWALYARTRGEYPTPGGIKKKNAP